MKKIILKLFSLYQDYNLRFNIFFISSFFLFTLISIFSYVINKDFLVFFFIFILLLLINFWILCIIYSKKKTRNSILELISIRNLVKKNNNLKGAEIGVYKGAYSTQILNFFESKKFLVDINLIDPWKVDTEFKEYGVTNLETAYQLVKKKFEKKDNVKILRLSSFEASKKFNDKYFDFIYIDGNHDYKYVKQDLEIWFPKLKDDGIIFGDDYLRPYGVNKAVKEFAFEKKMIVQFADHGNQFYFIKS